MAPNKIQCTGPRVVTAICTRDQGLATSNGSTSSRSQTVHKTAFSDQIKEQQVQDWVDTSSEYSRTPQFQALASMNAACQVTIPGDFLSGYPADELYFLGPCSDDDKSTGDNLPLEWNRNDFHTFGMPGSSDMIYTTSGDSHQVFSDCFKDEPHQGLLGCYPTPQTNWSSPSSAPMEPSLPSSYSRPSLLSKNFGSPISQSSHEDFSSNASNEESMLSPLSLGGPAQGAYHAPLFDPQYDTARFVSHEPPLYSPSNEIFSNSTLRPSNGFPRPSLANMPYPVSCDPHSVSMVGPSMDMQMYRRMSGESDNTTARNNALYHVGPREDGLYHCPFEAEGECGHKPEKLKCNYE